MNLLKKTSIKIIISLTFSLFISNFLISQVFFAKTPGLNPFFITKLQNIPQNLISMLATPINFITNRGLAGVTQTKPPSGLTFQSVSRGVSAGYDASTDTRYYKIEKGTKYEIRTYRLKMSDGQEKEIKVIIP